MNKFWSKILFSLAAIICSLFISSQVQAADHGAPIKVDLGLNQAEIKAGEQIQFSLIATDAENVSWDVSEDGAYSLSTLAGGTWQKNVYTAEKKGIWQVEADYFGLKDSISFTVNPNVLSYIAINPVVDQTIIAGETISFTAAAYDQFNNLRDDVINWENATNGEFSQTVAGTYEVYAFASGITSQKVQVNVSHATINHLELTPNTSKITADDSQAFVTYAVDEYGNKWVLDDLSGVQYRIIETEDMGSWSNNVYTPMVIGTWTVEAKYSGLTTTTTLTVTHGKAIQLLFADPTNIHLSNADQIQQYRVYALDQKGNLWCASEYDGGVTFSTTDPDGKFITNVYYDGKVGTWEIIAKLGDLSIKTNVTVDNPGVAESIIVSNPPEKIETNNNYQLNIKLYDKNGNEITGRLYTWKITDGADIATIDQTGYLHALKAGKITVSVKYANIETLITINLIDPVVQKEKNKVFEIVKVAEAKDDDNNNGQTILNDANGKIASAETEIVTEGPQVTTQEEKRSAVAMIMSILFALIILSVAYYGYIYFNNPKMAEVEVPIIKSNIKEDAPRDMAKPEAEVEKITEIKEIAKDDEKNIVKDDENVEKKNSKLRW